MEEQQLRKTAVISVPGKQINSLKTTPLTFIDGWDMILVIMAATVRLFLVMKYKALELQKKNVEFRLEKYFNQRHIIRWAGHYFTAMVLLLVLPEIVLEFIGPKYFPQFSDWSFFGSFFLGFWGYDLVKWLEAATLPLIRKYLKIKI